MDPHRKPRSNDGNASTDPGLENRLRSMILTNETQTVAMPSLADGYGRSEGLGSHDTTTRQDIIPPFQASAPSVVSPPATSNASKNGTKRPNQAQRRQMGSQFSIPIDSKQYNSHQQRSNIDVGHFRHGSYPTRLERKPPYAESQRENSHSTLRSGPPFQTMWNNHGSVQPMGAPRFSQQTFDRHRDPAMQHHPPPYSQQTSPNHSDHHHHPHHYSRRQFSSHEETAQQAALLDNLCYDVVIHSEIDRNEIAAKEAFRQKMETLCQQVIADYEASENPSSKFNASSVELKCFGSLSSGFATKASDMDLGLFSPMSKLQPDAAGSPIPRLVEKAFLESGHGARLLSRTRVPIIKLCESPPAQLLQALLAERAKWEDGTEGYDALEDEEPAEDLKLLGGSDTHKAEKAVGDVSSFEFELPAPEQDGATLRFHLKQNSNSSLSAYYGLAKRVLRRVGGRDVTMSNHREFSNTDWVVLNLVCKAFVDGLYDTSLRQHLATFPSLSFDENGSSPKNRSLAGVFTQVEGEQTLLAWEHWVGQKSLPDPQDQARHALQGWNNVRQKVDFGFDPIIFNKDLQVAIEKIKRLPSVQLMQLEQTQAETASQYYTRVRNMIHSLDISNEDDHLSATREIASCYISGIINTRVSGEVAAAVSQSKDQVSLDELGQIHKCLHLAHELEIALKDGLYDKALTCDITEYCTLLRSPLRKVQLSQGATSFLIPLADDSLSLVARMSKVRDPHALLAGHSRDRFKDPLEFPATGAGVQCDINFSAHLALQNTLLLRCYSLTDPRVRPMVLFIKHWAKVRKINSGYRGTLSSYGYVLMVLHYLINIARPFVCPNLQQLATPSSNQVQTDLEPTITCRGHNVQFWRNEHEIMQLAAKNQLNSNTETIGYLLRGFFEYFAQSGIMSQGGGKGFDWGRDVLSIRTQGGLLTKHGKGWTGAKTVLEGPSVDVNGLPYATSPSKADLPVNSKMGNDKRNQIPSNGPSPHIREVRHRYLFAIEDPFELDHNVARTVTHNGIVSIRDEFRRAWRIIRASGHNNWQEDLLGDVQEPSIDTTSVANLLLDMHGPKELWGTI